MIEKIMITQDQADEIKDIEDIAYAIDIHSFKKRPDKAIAELSTADLARALLIGYEIKAGYKTGEWVRYWKNDSVTAIDKITYIDYELDIVQFEHTTFTKKITDVRRYATPEEIKSEKERRKWAEIEEGDVLRLTPWADKIGILIGDADDETVLVQMAESQKIWRKEKVELYAKKVGEAK